MGKSKIDTSKNTTLVQKLADCEEVLLTLDDAAILLSKSREAIKKMCQRKRLPAHKNGKTWYLLKSEIVAELRQDLCLQL